MAKVFTAQCRTCGKMVAREGELYEDYRTQPGLVTDKLRTFDSTWTQRGFDVIELIMPDHELKRELKPSTPCEHCPKVRVLVKVKDNPEFALLFTGVQEVITLHVEPGMVADTHTLQLVLDGNTDPQRVVDSINRPSQVWPARAWIEDVS